MSAKGADNGFIFCNYRADRARQILYALTEKNFLNFSRLNEKIFMKAIGMIAYDANFKKKFNVLFEIPENCCDHAYT